MVTETRSGGKPKSPTTVVLGSKRRRSFGKKMDPYEALGEDILTSVMYFLDHEDLENCMLVSKGWSPLASSDLVWKRHCNELWKDKVFNPTRAEQDLPRREAYYKSIAASKRTKITAEELCAFEWKFKFKEEAGEFWISLDPFYASGEKQMMRRYFHLDNTMTVPLEDPFVWHGANECRWRFTKTKEKKRGHFVKVNHWPSLEIYRNPVSWGWVMENCWVVYEADLASPDGPWAAGVPSRGGEAAASEDGSTSSELNFELLE